jgi:hypothetical protein
MSLNTKAITSYALRSRIAHSKAMYAGDYAKVNGSNNPVNCNSNGQCRANLYTSPKYQYGTRLLDLQLGQLECCRSNQTTSQTTCGCPNYNA